MSKIEYPTSAHHWEAAGASAVLAFVGASDTAGSWMQPWLIIAGILIASYAIWMFAGWLTENPIPDREIEQ